MQEIKNIKENRKYSYPKLKERTLKLTSAITPDSNPSRVVVISNLEGNTFILSKQSLKAFEAEQIVKQQLQKLTNHSSNIITTVNKSIYQIWRKDHQSSNLNILAFNINMLKIYLVVIFLLCLLLLQFSFSFNFQGIFLGCFFIIWLVVLVVTIGSVCYKFQDFNYQKEVIITFRSILSKYNTDFFIPHQYILKCDYEATWFCLRRIKPKDMINSQSISRNEQ